MDDWEINPDAYQKDSDGNFVLKKDGTPRKKGGRPQGATSNYQYTNEQKAKIEENTRNDLEIQISSRPRPFADLIEGLFENNLLPKFSRS